MKAVLFILPILVFAGLVFSGIVHIPGVNDPPKKPGKSKHLKGSKDAKSDSDTKADAPADASATPPVEAPKLEAKKDDPPKTEEKPKAIEPILDPKKGAQALALVWNEMDAAKLDEITKQWKDEELTPVLAEMDNAKVVELLSKMDAKRASVLSKNLQKQASIVPEPGAPK